MSWVIMGSAGTLLLILGAGFAVFYSGFFVRPIKKLHNGADAIAGGDFKSRVDVKTGDELEQLANGMNEMAEKLDSFYGTLEKQIEERTTELRYERDKLIRVFEAMKDGVYLVDQDYNIQYLNPVLLKEFGPIEGKKCYALFHDRTEVCPWCPNQRVFAGETVRWEWTSLKSGKTYDLLDTPLNAPDGSIWKLEIFRDITEHKQTEAAFRTLVGTAVINIGAEFFHETVSSLCTWLGVECVIIGELVDEGMVHALAMQVDGKAVEHFEYALAGTPCESATQKGYCEYHEGVVQLFPADKDLVDLRAEAYAGTPTRDKNGKVNGILCAISRHKFVPPPMVKEVFEIIAARVGTEIERKKAEAQLKNSEERYRLIIQTSMDGFWITDIKGRILDVNDAYCQLIGYAREELLNMRIPDVEVKETLEETAQHIQEIMTKGYARFETLHRRKDGQLLDIEVSVVHRSDKENGRFFIFLRDITVRKLMDEKLQLTDFALDHAVDSVFWMEPSGKFRYVNETACRVLGYSKEELLSMSVADIDPNLPEGVPLEMSQATKNAGIGRVESEHRAKDGHLIPVEIIVAYLQYKGEEFHCSFVRDITERKAAEEELRLRAQLLDSVSDTIFVLDFNGKFVYLNEAAWKTRGYTRDEMMGINLHVLDTPKYEKLIESRMSDLMEKGQSIFESEQRRKDGSVMPVEINACIIELGERKLVLSIIRDITERKKAEEKIREQLDYLERFQKVAVKREFRIKELTDETEKLTAEIERLKKRD